MDLANFWAALAAIAAILGLFSPFIIMFVNKVNATAKKADMNELKVNTVTATTEKNSGKIEEIEDKSNQRDIAVIEAIGELKITMQGLQTAISHLERKL